MVYEVFDSSGNSIFPTNGSGGLTSYSGAVNPGDMVILKLVLLDWKRDHVLQGPKHRRRGLSDVQCRGCHDLCRSLINSIELQRFLHRVDDRVVSSFPLLRKREEVLYSDKAFGLTSA